MNNNPRWLLDYQHDVYSQSGEDGIIKKILDNLPERDHWCVEFGAWDGIHLSNTRNLIESKGYKAILIEPDHDRFSSLQENYANQEGITTINCIVGFEGNDRLDAILETTTIPQNFDLLCIDIDGNDYHVWDSVSKYRPKVVMIEFNPTIPTSVRFSQPKDLSINQGSSLLSIVELAKTKGYELVCALPFNAFFVQKEYYPLYGIECNSPEVLRANQDEVTYLFSGYDGTLLLSGSCKNPWHNIELKESKIQHLPKILRMPWEKYSWLHKVLFFVRLAATDPVRLISICRNK